MKLIGILNELYNNNKLEKRKFKVPDGTITDDVSDVLKHMGLKQDWFDIDDVIESLQADIEIIEEEKEIKKLNYEKLVLGNNLSEVACNIINELIDEVKKLRCENDR